MRQKFTKMHGLGNDFIMLDGRGEVVPELRATTVTALADSTCGIGCDQLILLEPSEHADFQMRIFNADGSEVEACGNAARAVALLHGAAAKVETGGGVIALSPNDDGTSAAVDMGVPKFGWEDIPLSFAMDTLAMPVSWDNLENPAAVNVGNPHVIFFVEDVSKVSLDTLGPQIETDPLFPERVNVNAASVTGRGAITLRVWERGAGETRACGTGACASAIAAMRRGLVDRKVAVTLPGGTLHIEWDVDDHIHMSGPAQTSFTGVFEWDDYP